jgi:putative transposase
MRRFTLLILRFEQWRFIPIPGGVVTHVLNRANARSRQRASLYQGTYKSFPIQNDEHFLTVCRYVEQNPLRAGLVQKAEDWRWSSLGSCSTETAKKGKPVLSEWPVPRPTDWVSFVNEALTSKELESLRVSAQRGRPLVTKAGKHVWQNNSV